MHRCPPMSCSPLLSALQNLGWEISTMCNNRSASRTSSNVDLKESTKSVGNLRINPTVSDSRNGRFSMITLRTVVSNVANSLFSAKTSHFRKQSHQCGFSYIGISHQCHTNQASAVLPLGRLLLVNLSQTLLQQ